MLQNYNKYCTYAKKILPLRSIMIIGDKIYRFFSYLWHQVSAWNTGGEGIHSPYLFYLVRMLFYERSPYYVFEDIEKRRRQMLQSDKKVYVEDYGTGKSGERRISQVAASSLKPANQAQLLFRLVQFLSHDSKRELNILELGTSLGITTAYMAAPDKRNRVVTMEGSDELAKVAIENWNELKLDNIEVVTGDISNTLYIYARERKKQKLDFVFMDANHTAEATLKYYNLIQPMLHDKSIIVLDDIHHVSGMYRVWRHLCGLPEVTTSMDLYHFGLLFFDPHYIKRHYKLRI